MRLAELDPRWIAPDTFAFRCPHCQRLWLTCTLRKIEFGEQYAAGEAAFKRRGRRPAAVWVQCDPECAWTASSRDFQAMSVTPSLDASKAGHWHGFITNGEIVGGI